MLAFARGLRKTKLWFISYVRLICGLCPISAFCIRFAPPLSRADRVVARADQVPNTLVDLVVFPRYLNKRRMEFSGISDIPL